MFGWLATHVARVCPHAAWAEVAVERQWSRIAPRQLARCLPAAGCVLYLPCAAPDDVEGTAPRLLVGGPELAPLLCVHWLVAASMIVSDGPHEWLECRARDGRLCARLHLLPDSDYLGWDALQAAGEPVAGATTRGVGVERFASARLLGFRCRRLAGIDVLEASSVAKVSALGGGIARGIVHAEGLALG